MRTNRQVPREILREAIYEAAVAEFREHGYDSTTVEAITQRAQVAKGTFFNFYPTKAALLQDFYWRIDKRIAPLRSALDPHHPHLSLRRYAVAVEREFHREGALLISLLLESFRNDALRQTDTESGEADAAEFAAFFQKARSIGSIRRSIDPQQAARVLIDVWAGSVREWLFSKGTTNLAKQFATKLNLVFQGLAPKETR